MEELIEENKLLKLKNAELEEKLKKYTNSEGHKRYGIMMKIIKNIDIM